MATNPITDQANQEFLKEFDAKVRQLMDKAHINNEGELTKQMLFWVEENYPERLQQNRINSEITLGERIRHIAIDIKAEREIRSVRRI